MYITSAYDNLAQDITEKCRRSKLPRSLEAVTLDSNQELDLEQWLPALAALPCCHSLGLIYSGNLAYAGDDDAFDAIAVRSGLATSLELRLLTSNYKALPALAAERAGRGLPCVAIGSKHDGWKRCRLEHAWGNARCYPRHRSILCHPSRRSSASHTQLRWRQGLASKDCAPQGILQ